VISLVVDGAKVHEPPPPHNKDFVTAISVDMDRPGREGRETGAVVFPGIGPAGAASPDGSLHPHLRLPPGYSLMLLVQIS